TVATYLRGLGDLEVRELPFPADGRTDPEALRAGLGADTRCLVLGYPNVFGMVEDVAPFADAVHAVGGLVITATAEPLALALVRSPGASGADIAVAEGQSFGLPVCYGGPGVGLFATRERFVRSMPGRLVGETVDAPARDGVVAGFPLGRWCPEREGSLLLCVTETHTPEQVDRLVDALAAPAPAARAAGG